MIYRSVKYYKFIIIMYATNKRKFLIEVFLVPVQLLISHFKVSGTTPTESKLMPGYEQFLNSSPYSLQTEIFLQNIAENRFSDPLAKKFMLYINEFCQEHHINVHLNLSADHPVEEIGW